MPGRPPPMRRSSSIEASTSTFLTATLSMLQPTGVPFSSAKAFSSRQFRSQQSSERCRMSSEWIRSFSNAGCRPGASAQASRT